jgi:O-glycosyl hydrolase
VSALGAAAIAGRPVLALADGLSTAGQAAAPAEVGSIPLQIMQGFGASGAWWPNDLGRFRPDVREQVADMLFGREGIQLSVYRYNIGGGGTGVDHTARAPETFLVSPGVYDWSKDPGGRLFLRLAAERGVPILIGFVNSAPAVWTTNGNACGGSLAVGAEAPFARYLADVVVHFRDAEEIKFSYVSPMNEPDNDFDSCGQEGMSVPVDQRAILIRALADALAVRAPECQVIADESSRAGEQFMREAAHWLDAPGVADDVAALAVHRYDCPNDLILQLAAALSDAYGKPLWSTELCCFDSRTGSWGPQYDPTVENAVMMANFIWQGMTEANDAAFHWWVACSSVIGADLTSDPEAPFRPNDDGWNDGLLYYDPNYADNGNQRIYATKRYYALGNFSRYVRPGDCRFDITGGPRNLRLLAFATGPGTDTVTPPTQLPMAQLPQANTWTVIVINNAPAGSDATALRLQLPISGRERLVPTTAVETSAERNLEPVELPRMTGTGLLSSSIPAQSITTYRLDAASRAALSG